MKKKFKLTKDSLARMCAEAGLQPETREPFLGYDIFIGHGFVTQPEVKLQRFGVEREMFPFGCYCTLWSVAKGEDFILIASVNPYLDGRERSARINEARREAQDFIGKLKLVTSQGANALYH